MVRRDFNFPVHVIDPLERVRRRLRDAATSYQLLDHSLLSEWRCPFPMSDRHGTVTQPGVVGVNA
ncbi:MAG: hypothetical protein OXG43_12720 [Chloroflexi bacterium]|nr:hypothetical protein [Chloroflexota bacterium]